MKVKRIPLNECRVKYRDPTEKMSDKAFVVVDGLGNHSKYSAKTPSLAQAWVDKIRLVISQEEERLKREVKKMPIVKKYDPLKFYGLILRWRPH